MPSELAVRNRCRVRRGRAGPGLLKSGFVRPAATIVTASSPFLPIGVSWGGAPVGQTQRFQSTERIAANSRRTGNVCCRRLVNGLHLRSQHGCEPQVHAGLRDESWGYVQFLRDNGEFRGYSLSRFPVYADNQCMEKPILRRHDERTRGMNACR